MRQEAPSVLPLEFRVSATCVPPTHAVFITGNIDALGNNDRSRAVRLSDATHPLWSATVPLSDEERSQVISYRYFHCIVNDDGSPSLEELVFEIIIFLIF